MSEMATKSFLIKPWSRRTKDLSRNPHLWILIALFSTLTIIYVWDMVFYNQRWDWLYHLTVFEFRYSLHGSLFCIPIIYAAYIFWWRGALITWLLSICVVIPWAFTYRHDPLSLFENLFFLLIPLLLVIYFAIEHNWREKERKALAEREVERKSYISRVLRAHEDERLRISQELHDDPTQTLLVIANRVQALVSDGQSTEDERKIKELEWIRDMTLSVSEGLKRICLDLRPSILDDLGLVAALRWVVEEFNKVSGIKTSLEIYGIEHKLSPEKEVTLFRIVQEALNNIRRHSQATVSKIRISFDADMVKITIQDNGKGFSLEQTRGELATNGKLGLIGMQERTQLLDGKFQLNSDPGQGTLITVEVKLN